MTRIRVVGWGSVVNHQADASPNMCLPDWLLAGLACASASLPLHRGRNNRLLDEYSLRIKNVYDLPSAWYENAWRRNDRCENVWCGNMPSAEMWYSRCPHRAHSINVSLFICLALCVHSFIYYEIKMKVCPQAAVETSKHTVDISYKSRSLAFPWKPINAFMKIIWKFIVMTKKDKL